MTWHLHHSCEPIRTARKEIRPAFSSSFKIMLSFALFKTWHSPYMLSLMVVSRVTSCTLGPIKKILKNFLQLQWEFKNVCWTPPGVLDCFGWISCVSPLHQHLFILFSFTPTCGQFWQWCRTHLHSYEYTAIAKPRQSLTHVTFIGLWLHRLPGSIFL